MTSFVVKNCRAVLPESVMEDAVVRVEEGTIVEISRGREPVAGLDAQGTWLLPGFVDMHSDAIEKAVEPRPNARFPTEVALRELDRCLAGWGVTTIFHSLSFADMEIGLRSNGMAAALIDEVVELSPHLRVDTRIHARFEVTDLDAVRHLRRLVGEKKIELLSFMDHSPGQGQYRDVAAYKAFYGKTYAMSDSDLDKVLERKTAAKENGVFRAMEEMAALCREHGVAMASHDDDSQERIEWCLREGVAMSEFPINLGTARAAKAAGIRTCLGAPNLVRGGSQAGNLKALTAVEDGCADILCSDYLPQSLVHAVFLLHVGGILSLPQAVAMASLAPARATGIGDVAGSIELGKRADLVLVRMRHGLPDVVRTWSRGNEVYASC